MGVGLAGIQPSSATEQSSSSSPPLIGLGTGHHVISSPHSSLAHFSHILKPGIFINWLASWLIFNLPNNCVPQFKLNFFSINTVQNLIEAVSKSLRFDVRCLHLPFNSPTHKSKILKCFFFLLWVLISPQDLLSHKRSHSGWNMQKTIGSQIIKCNTVCLMLALRCEACRINSHHTSAESQNRRVEVWQSSLQQQTDSLEGWGAEDEAKGEKQN